MTQPDAGQKPDQAIDYAAVPHDRWRAVTLKGPWDFPIVVPPVPDGPEPKRPENRTWSTAWRGPILIHAGLGWDTTGERDPNVTAYWTSIMGDRPLHRDNWSRWRGHVIAVATITDCHQAKPNCCKPWGQYSSWDSRLHHLILDQVQPLVDLAGLIRDGKRAPLDLRTKGSQALWNPHQRNFRIIDAVRRHLPEA